MPKYVIERDLPGAGQLSGDELQAISQKSVEVLDSMAGRAQWLESYRHRRQAVLRLHRRRRGDRARSTPMRRVPVQRVRRFHDHRPHHRRDT